MNRLVFLGSNNLYSELAAEYINSLERDILVEHKSPSKFTNFPKEYDLGIAFMYSYLIPKEELKKAIWINIHPAPLPKYGGRNVAYHAIKNKETKFGSTIHLMSEKFDQGDIISNSYFNIPKDTTAYELYDMSCKDGLKHIMKVLPKILNKDFKAKKQVNPYYYKQQKINNFINLSESNKLLVQALYYPPYYPQIKIGNKVFDIILNKNKND